ncbi:hypothetical protein ACFSO7_01105 [Bacillus sp. CGMCC 1.16607]|uniref:hypothetical protein n=1 Tax=Bacillus sp. CGMCC 1.16607 TaxID=3351842 RepID=UPI00363C3253
MTNEENLLGITQILEKQFSYNNYNGFDNSVLPYSLKLGKHNILISAPHAVNHIRENRVKKADIYTGTIASIVQLHTNAFCIYSNRISEEDPNYITGGQYKEAIKGICNQFGIDLILDIHGADLNREFDIDLGTIYGKSISNGKVDSIKNIFNNNGINNVKVNEVFSASHPGTITYFSKNSLNVSAIQIEINRFFRDPNSNLGAYTSLINSLIDIVNHFKKE